MAPNKGTRPKSQARPAGPDTPVGFKTVFWVVVALTALSLLVSAFLATRPREMQTENLREVVQTCNNTWKLGLGTIIGLLAGRRLPER